MFLTILRFSKHKLIDDSGFELVSLVAASPGLEESGGSLGFRSSIKPLKSSSMVPSVFEGTEDLIDYRRSKALFIFYVISSFEKVIEK